MGSIVPSEKDTYLQLVKVAVGEAVKHGANFGEVAQAIYLAEDLIQKRDGVGVVSGSK